MKKIDQVKKQYDSDKHLDYHLSQFDEPKESTKAILDFILPIIDNKKYNVADYGCGAGANINYFSNYLTNSKWIGIDSSKKYIDIANKKIKNKKVDFLNADFFTLTKRFDKLFFDVSFCLQTLLVLPNYDSLMDEIFSLTKKYIIISSLFTDFDVDVISEVKEYPSQDYEKFSFPYYYNIYSFNKFKKYCYDKGATEIFSKNFSINIDLNKPKNNLMGTYTLDTKSKGKIQFSGPINMPWKMICIKLD